MTARGSFGTLYRRTQRNTSDHSSIGVVEASWCSSRRRAASRGSGQSGRRGGLGRFDLGRHNGTTKNHVFSGGRGSPIRLASSARPLALLEQRRAVASVAHGWPFVLRRSGLFGTSVLVSTVVLHVGVIRHRCRRRAALRVLHAPVSSRASRWRGAHSSDGITPGCTRRRRARFSQSARGEPV